MKHVWTFGRTIAIGFTAVVGLNLVVAGIALIGLDSVVHRKDRVIDRDSRLVLDVQKLLTIRDARAAANRGYLISGDRSFLDQQDQYDDSFNTQLDEIRGLVDTVRGRELVIRVSAMQSRFVQLDGRPVQLREQGAATQVWAAAWERINTERVATTAAMDDLSDYQQTLVDSHKRAASDAAALDVRLIVAVVIGSVLASATLAVVLIRRLRTRIGGAVAEVQSSSAELQTTANQQATGAREQAMAMTEISTTMSELLASSQQISGSAQRVAATSDQTAGAGRTGTSTVVAAQRSMTEIHLQVTAILGHMLELGDKSQRIGSVLDIVSGLAEQTNLLAINSTIEAAGAGASGRRFAVVADEIRKLADRVAESTKEIRELIDGVRGAVGTTALATELGAKAVEAGSAQVEAVAASFEEIVALVRTTTQAAREIELSTKQQTIAVEQVNLAITDVTQSTLQTETSSGHTLQTASQLRGLSTELRGLVEAGTSLEWAAAGLAGTPAESRF